MKFKYPLLLVLVPLFALFAGYEYLKRSGIVMPVEIFGTFLLIVLIVYSYLWQKKWKEDRKILLEQMENKKEK